MIHETGPIVDYLERSRDVVEAAIGDRRLVETIAAVVTSVGVPS